MNDDAMEMLQSLIYRARRAHDALLLIESRHPDAPRGQHPAVDIARDALRDIEAARIIEREAPQ